MPRVLVLSTTTGYQLRSFGAAAGQLGVELMFATDRCHAIDDPWRDAAVPVRFHDEAESLGAVLGAARQRPIDGVVAVGDRPVVLAARIASALGLPGNRPEAALASANKRLAREKFARAGLPVPAHVHTTVGDGVECLSARLSYPVVIKPVGLSGSRGVIRANSAAELSAAFGRLAALLSRRDIRAQRTGTDQDLVIETFVEGREYAIEGLITGGVFTPLALFDKPDPLNGPFFEETIYVTPSALPRAVQEEVFDAVGRAAVAIGLHHGPVHAECRVNPTGIFVLEVAARPIGGLCSRVLRFRDEATSPFASPTSRAPETEPSDLVSLEHVLLRHALGRDVSGTRRERSAAAVMMIPIPRRGVLKRVGGQDDARRVPLVEDVLITAKPDQLLEPLPEAGSYLGFIFARAPRTTAAEQAVREAHGRLTFTIDPAIAVTTESTADVEAR